MAMNCEILRDRMLDALDGAVPAELQAHLNTCPGCAGKLAELRQTMTLLDEWQAPEVSPYFDLRLQTRLREEQRSGARGRFAWLGFKPAAAALAVLVLIGAGLLNIGPTPPAGPLDPAPVAVASADSAVADLETLDANEELLANFELLDQIEDVHENGT
jgi:anti-sigma factor RsiW